MPFINVNAIRCAVLAAAFAAGPLLLSAAANADPDPDPASPVDPRAQCESLDVGGVFTTTTSPDGVAHSVCTYIVEGFFYYDNYDNGVYTDTLINKDGAKVPTARPDVAPLVPLPQGFPIAPLPGGFGA